VAVFITSDSSAFYKFKNKNCTIIKVEDLHEELNDGPLTRIYSVVYVYIFTGHLNE
jgi:hypothetical protein